MKRLIATAAVCGVSLFGFTAVAGADAVTYNPAPQAAFTVTTGAFFAHFCGFAATFRSYSSAPAGTSITQYAWNFGSAGSLVTTSPQVVRLFRPGSYDVTLTVTDSAGASASTSRIVSAGDLSYPFHC